jgi:hypothetical protein
MNQNQLIQNKPDPNQPNQPNHRLMHGRLDLIARCVTASMFISFGTRRNTDYRVSLYDRNAKVAPRCVRRCVHPGGHVVAVGRVHQLLVELATGREVAVRWVHQAVTEVTVG